MTGNSFTLPLFYMVITVVIVWVIDIHALGRGGLGKSLIIAMRGHLHHQPSSRQIDLDGFEVMAIGDIGAFARGKQALQYHPLLIPVSFGVFLMALSFLL
jgi:hypothetical protein